MAVHVHEMCITYCITNYSCIIRNYICSDVALYSSHRKSLSSQATCMKNVLLVHPIFTHVTVRYQLQPSKTAANDGMDRIPA